MFVHSAVEDQQQLGQVGENEYLEVPVVKMHASSSSGLQN
jgi:hypothetical protein